jgi:AcrR family transcriptional regulator
MERDESRKPIAVPRSLPRGQHALGRDVVLLSQRARMFEAIVRAVADKGYAATTVEDVTRRAGVSRTSFYEQFKDKEDCFLAAYEAGAHAHQEHITAAIRRATGWMDQLRAGTAAYVEVLAAQPEYARTFLLEVNAAGPRAHELTVQAHGRYADVLREVHKAARVEHPQLPDIPDEVFSGAVGAINEVVATQIRAGATERLNDLLPTLVYIELALLGMPSEPTASPHPAPAP